MTFGQMQAFINRFIDILSIKDNQLRNTRLEVLMNDIEAAYEQDPFASKLNSAIEEEL